MYFNAWRNTNLYYGAHSCRSIMLIFYCFIDCVFITRNTPALNLFMKWHEMCKSSIPCRKRQGSFITELSERRISLPPWCWQFSEESSLIFNCSRWCSSDDDVISVFWNLRIYLSSKLERAAPIRYRTVFTRWNTSARPEGRRGGSHQNLLWRRESFLKILVKETK